MLWICDMILFNYRLLTQKSERSRFIGISLSVKKWQSKVTFLFEIHFVSQSIDDKIERFDAYAPEVSFFDLPKRHTADSRQSRQLLLRNISRIRIDDIKEMLAKAHSVWFDPDVEPFEVRLFIDGSVAKYFERKPILGQRVEGRDSDGSLEVVVKITDAMEIIPLVKTWLPTIHVLEPEWLDEEIREDIEAYLEKESEV